MKYTWKINFEGNKPTLEKNGECHPKEFMAVLLDFLDAHSEAGVKSFDMEISFPGIDKKVTKQDMNGILELFISTRRTNKGLDKLDKEREREKKESREEREKSLPEIFVLKDGRPTLRDFEIFKLLCLILDEKISIAERRNKLLDFGIDRTPYGVNLWGENPLVNYLIACEHPDWAAHLMESLPDIIDPSLKDWENKDALIIAAKVPTSHDLVPMLLTQFKDKLNLNAQDKNGCTALHYACAYGAKELVDKLLNAGTSFDVKDNKGRTPFDYCKLEKKELLDIAASVGINCDRDWGASRNNLPPRFVMLIHDLERKGAARIRPIKEDIEKLLQRYDRTELMEWETVLVAKGCDGFRQKVRDNDKKKLTDLLAKYRGMSVIDYALQQREELLKELEAREKKKVLDEAPSFKPAA